MTQEEKKLLLKDLCARVYYGVLFMVHNDEINEPVKLLSINPKRDKPLEINDGYDENSSTYWNIEDVKPYLRPMSSMTEEEYTGYCTMRGRNCDYGEATISVSKSLYPRHLYDDGEPVKITVFYPNPVIQD